MTDSEIGYAGVNTMRFRFAAAAARTADVYWEIHPLNDVEGAMDVLCLASGIYDSAPTPLQLMAAGELGEGLRYEDAVGMECGGVEYVALGLNPSRTAYQFARATDPDAPAPPPPPRAEQIEMFA